MNELPSYYYYVGKINYRRKCLEKLYIELKWWEVMDFEFYLTLDRELNEFYQWADYYTVAVDKVDKSEGCRIEKRRVKL